MSLTPPSEPVKVFFVCTGVGIVNRGVESLFREAFDGLHDLEGFDITLYKGRGVESEKERLLWCLAKTGGVAKFLGRCVRREPYVIEQLSSLYPLIRQIKKHRPRLIFNSDPALMRRLHYRRKSIGVDFRIVYPNGLPIEQPADYIDHTQQVAPFYVDRAMELGGDPSRMTLLPLGITAPDGPVAYDPEERKRLRRELGLPEDRPIVLSVGWISKNLKRMDYTVDEIAALPSPRPFLMMLGSIDATSRPIIEQARQKLGEGNFAARSVPYEQVPPYYKCADMFVLSSLKEGFGRVYIEALMYGLPSLANDHPVHRYVLGSEGTFADLSKPGGFAPAVPQVLSQKLDSESMARRWRYVRDKYSWKSLRTAYAEMFRKALAAPPLPQK